MRIFLVCGKAGSGKNEVSSLIAKHLDKTVVTSLAKYIKMFALEMTDWNGEDNNKPRTFLQQMGDSLRAIDINFLTRRVVEDFCIYEKYYDNVVISDVRLESEINYFKQYFKKEVYVIDVQSKEHRRNLNLDEKKHVTETELDLYKDFDYVIQNDFSDFLENEVIDMLKGIE